MLKILTALYILQMYKAMALKCYTGVKVESNPQYRYNQTECGCNEICTFVDYEEDTADMARTIAFGMCETRQVCEALECNELKKQINDGKSGPTVTSQRCSRTCCDQPLCTSSTTGSVTNILNTLFAIGLATLFTNIV